MNLPGASSLCPIRTSPVDDAFLPTSIVMQANEIFAFMNTNNEKKNAKLNKKINYVSF